MHVQVITGQGRDGATKQLKHLKELQEWIGEASQMVHAEAYSAAGLVEILQVRGATEQELLVLECTREQIQAVLEWQSATDEVIELENLVLHLVRQVQPTTAGEGR
ncbi:hypothetical protein [Pseudomonas sp. R3-18-08]|uniref:hypothetical protein n=1 Tax=Pseudomonas sp. R3-18-08 TaxID=1173283 RepID=UPI000F56A197|nr:hypothetical protein [Pseudomonas sp. R3-18-08]AZF13848.1 hypothetical protein C4J92_0332 [Pseudomonas sp. R3-18-08]